MMNILITVDNNYLEIALKMLYSVKLYNNDLRIYVIYDDLTTESIEKLRSFVNDNKIGIIKFYYLDSEKLNLSVINSDYLTKTCYLRLYSPFIITDVDRLLYLDPDIVCQGSLKELYNTDLGDCIIAGCKNMLRDEVKDLHKHICKRLKLPYDTDYINSGVLLIDTNKYREFTSPEKINKFIQDNKKTLEYQDQDTINSVFYKKIKIMDNTYNYQINAENYWKITLDKILIHYSEGKKPWKETYDDTFRAMPYYYLLSIMGKRQELMELVQYHSMNNPQYVFDIINARKNRESDK